MRYFGVAAVVLVAITAAASEEQTSRNVTSASEPTKMTKREAILLDSMPLESSHGYRKQPKVIYRRVSRVKSRPYHMHGHGKPRRPPSSHKYGPPKNVRRPPKKHATKHLKTKYMHPKSRRNQKPKKHPSPTHHKYNIPMRFGAPRAPYIPQEPAGFGEPPANHFAFNKPNPSFGEPPTDSYGAPLYHSPKESHTSYKSTSFSQNSYASPEYEDHLSFPPNNYDSNQQDSYSVKPQTLSHYSMEPNHAASSHSTQNFGSNHAASSQSTQNFGSKHVASKHPKHNFGSNHAASSHPTQNFESNHAASAQSTQHFGSNYAPIGLNYYESNEEVIKGNSKAPAEEYSQNLKLNLHNYENDHETSYNPKPAYPNHQSDYLSLPSTNKHAIEPLKSVNQLRNGLRVQKHTSGEVLVGGQYAEPPARYVPRFKPSAPMYTGDESFIPPVRMAADSEEAASSFQSSYVNYKNGNMAFSPQNLNDAFSVA